MSLLFPDGSQIADHLKPETLQHLLILKGQAEEMIGTVNAPSFYLTIIMCPVAADITKIDCPGER